jgi:tetrapyrrole methylase family protein / MazG family protein
MKRSFDELVAVMHRLRAPGGCPWDREQTMASLKPFVIEEAYEVVDAIDRNDLDSLCEELGDLMLQSLFLAELASESEAFDIHDSVTAIHDKLVRRHPHVFSDVKADTADEVLGNWEKLKSREKGQAGERKGVLSGVPAALPALLKASRLQEKAARVGFDWRRTDDVFEKLEEEERELREAVARNDAKEIEAEIGDLLFTVVNIARRLKINPEEALQSANRKFQRRFDHLERTIIDRNEEIDEQTLEELDALWNDAKARGL